MKTKKTRSSYSPKDLGLKKDPKKSRFSLKDEKEFWKSTAIIFLILFIIALFL